MVAKTSAARRAAFMAALRATGNLTVAAERAKVSRSWVCLHRASDPGFLRESDAAIAEARASLDRLGTKGSTKPQRARDRVQWAQRQTGRATARGSTRSGTPLDRLTR